MQILRDIGKEMLGFRPGEKAHVPLIVLHPTWAGNNMDPYRHTEMKIYHPANKDVGGPLIHKIDRAIGKMLEAGFDVEVCFMQSYSIPQSVSRALREGDEGFFKFCMDRQGYSYKTLTFAERNTQVPYMPNYMERHLANLITACRAEPRRSQSERAGIRNRKAAERRLRERG